ncbi:hypothetical protein OG455_09845 [Kitasatospora sp. NBC_01287]|uniref:hypothetical protein n=1 Tax=Kitasatospora sp. NBC_01287 TaxID=2903573 RepID=UPI00224CFCF3|nr:hypothetical protein [Kitasatospora sp. NBC_01287]MCX4745822.1 hypothetical protein [Kitasatospora sp. NBC_01287]
MSRDGAAHGPQQFIASLLRQPPESRPGPAALPVPVASAAEVIDVARRLALLGLPDEQSQPTPPPELLRLAMALVVDEHPSAPTWSPADRGTLGAWVALLIARRGEDGVQHLIRALNLD